MAKNPDDTLNCPAAEKSAATARAALLSFPVRAPRSPCPGDEAVALFVTARLDAGKRAAFLEHLDDCPACRQQLLRVRSALAREAGGSGVRVAFNQQVRTMQTVWKKVVFVLASAACVLLLLYQGGVMTETQDPLAALTAELAALPKTRSRVFPWLDASLQAAADDRTRLVYVGYAYEAALLKNRGKANLPVPPHAGGALPYYITGRLIFAMEQFCATEGEISRKRWESLTAYRQGQALEAAFGDLRPLFAESAPASCDSLRTAIESVFHAP
jgi:hypothetical protein